MGKIVTITFNPSLDKSTTAPRVVPESKLRCTEPVYEPGGGGVNVSRVLKRLGHNSLAIYTKGGPSGDLFESLLEKEGIAQQTIACESATRENFIVFETTTNNQFRFGMPGLPISLPEVDQVIQAVENLEDCDYLVASGSLPPGVPVDIYKTLGTIAKKKGIKYVVDSSQQALQQAFEAGVYLAKPNIHELENLVGKELADAQSQEAAARQIISQGKAQILVVSLGAAGAFTVTKDASFNVSAPSVKKKSTVGAGDSMVAGILYQLAKGSSIEHAVLYGVASGTAATMNEGTQLCEPTDVENLFNYLESKHTHLISSIK